MPVDTRQGIQERVAKRKAEKEAFEKKLSSARKKEKELRRLLRERNSFVNLVPVGIIAVEDGRVVEINKMVERQLGYSPGEMVGRPFVDFVDPDSREAAGLIHGRDVAHESQPHQYETNLLAKDGSVLRFDIRVQKVHHGGRTVLLSRLESIQGRTQEVGARFQAGKADALRAMAAGIVDSLRSPLAALAGRDRSLKRELASGGSSPGESMDRIADATSRISSLSHALDRYSRSDQDKSKVTLCDLRETVKDVVAAIEPQKKAGTHFKTYLRPVSLVEADPKEIREMLICLITNGIEAMPEGGDLYLSTEENAGYAHVFIQDSGAGIPDDVQTRMFDPFFTTKGAPHSGLGLSLSQGIVRKCKGALEITCRKGSGTIVSVKMPLARDKGKEEVGARKRKIKNAQILLIEDDHMIRELLSQLLRSKGFRVIKAVSSAEGLHQLKRKAVDMVIVGSQSPDVDGPLLAREIKKSHEKVPVALILGQESSRGKQAPGADLIMTKPLDMSQVVSEVSRVLISRDAT